MKAVFTLKWDLVKWLLYEKLKDMASSPASVKGSEHGAKSGKRRPRRRGRWAEQRLASYLRKNGCEAITNVQEVREIDVLGICVEGRVLHLLVIEVKSGRQLVDTPVLSRLVYIVRRMTSRKTPPIHTTRRIDKVEVTPVLVIGPRCSLTPQAQEYAVKHGIPVFRYSTRPDYSIEKIL